MNDESSVVYVARAGVPAGGVTGAFWVAVMTPLPPAVEHEPYSTQADCALLVVYGGAPCWASDGLARRARPRRTSAVVEVRVMVEKVRRVWGVLRGGGCATHSGLLSGLSVGEVKNRKQGRAFQMLEGGQSLTLSRARRTDDGGDAESSSPRTTTRRRSGT